MRATGAFTRCRVGAPALAARRIPLAPFIPRLARARRLRRIGRGWGGRRRHVAVEPRLLLVVERSVERLQLRLDGVEGRKRRGDALLRRLEPRRGRGGHVLRAVGGKPLRRLLGGIAQAVERLALGLVGADGAHDRIERPVLELGRLHGAAAHELVDRGAERARAAAGHVSALGGAAAAQLLVAIARAILAGAAPLVIARAPAVVPVAITIPPAVWIFGAALRAVLPAIVAARLVAILTLLVVLPLRLACPPLVERAGGRALAIGVIAVVAAPGVGARGHAHHQHRRKQHPRCPHE